MAAKKSAPQPRLTHDERVTVKEVVRNLRFGAASPDMRLVSDEIAVEVLEEEHDIVISLAAVRKIA